MVKTPHKDPNLSESKEAEEDDKVKRKYKVCYYVMKLAEYGELFRFIEHTDKFSERMAKNIFQ